MAQYKLKKGQKLGALSAESDTLLEKVFIDTGYTETLLNPSDPNFLILGRTGSGKTALLEHIRFVSEHTSNLDPDDLSMQYLHSSPVLKTIAGWGIHLDIFFKYLWRHICILELIKMRYGNDKDTAITALIKNWLFSDQKKTQAAALQYLEKHGEEYWITADTHIKAFTNDLESKITNDTGVKAKAGISSLNIEGSLSRKDETSAKTHVEAEVINRTQSIVNDYQIAALNEVVDSLSKHGFNDPKKKYFLVIDDLDKNWMPDDSFYLDLVKSLLYTVKELNQRLKCVKIIRHLS